QHAVDGRGPEAMPPLELDVRARFARSMRNSAEISGGYRAPRLIELNGWQYWHYADGARETPAHVCQRETFQRAGNALYERGENYLDTVIFPEMRAGNARLGAVNPDSLSDQDLADHLQDALEWYERGWTPHWT